MDYAHSSIIKLPDNPGVYFFIGKEKEVLYIGKATSIKDRIKSYFVSNLGMTRGAHMVHMVSETVSVDFRKTNSVLEALILEANLIKEFKPRYNTREKDDKSFNYLMITVDETFPRLLVVRGKDLPQTHMKLMRERDPSIRRRYREPLVFGPFPHAQQFYEALKIVRKIFPYYDTKRPVVWCKEKPDHRFRFNESLGIFPSKEITTQEYAKTIRHITTLFTGNIKRLIGMLEKDMFLYAKEKRFEEAAIRKRQIFSLQHIEDVSLLKREREYVARGGIRIEGYDVAHLQGSHAVGVMVVMENGYLKKKDYRTFTIRQKNMQDDVASLFEILTRRMAHTDWMYPHLVVVDGGKMQMRVSKKVLHHGNVQIPVVVVTKDEHHKPKKIEGVFNVPGCTADDVLLLNAEAHRFALAVHKRKRSKHLTR